MRETNVSGAGTAITNRAAAAAARNHTSHSDGDIGIVKQRGEQQGGVGGSQPMLGEITLVMVPGSTILSHNESDKVVDATATTVAASSSSRMNNRVNRFIGSSSSDASPHPSDESSTQVISSLSYNYYSY